MKKILVAIDFSECSLNALEHAITIARKAEADIQMAFIIKPESTREMFTEGPQTLGAMVKDKFEEIIEKYHRDMGTRKLTYTIAEGKIYREIIKLAEHKDVFLVMVGTHGASGFEEFWIGSNAFRVVSSCPKPTISIRGGVNIKKDLQRIVLPIDSTPETRQKVPFTSYMAGVFGAQIHILAIYSTEVHDIRRMVDGYCEQVMKHLNEENVRHVLEHMPCENLTDATIEYAHKIDANLISIMTEQEKSTRNLLLGPYAQQMVNHSPFPVLCIQPRDSMTSLGR